MGLESIGSFERLERIESDEIVHVYEETLASHMGDVFRMLREGDEQLAYERDELLEQEYAEQHVRLKRLVAHMRAKLEYIEDEDERESARIIVDECERRLRAGNLEAAEHLLWQLGRR